MPEPRPPEDQNKPHPPPLPPPPKHDVPPHILKEIMDMKEKIGKLEGMMEMLLRQQGK